MSAGTWRDVAAARRVLLHGVTGSGKSTLARALGALLHLPVTLVDEEMWLPGWVPVPEEQADVIAAGWLARDRWILDSVYGRHREDALARADVVIGLDYPRWLSLVRLVRRTVAGAVSREPRCNGNVESVRLTLSRDSIILWHFRSWRPKREAMRAWYADPTAPPVVLLRSPADADALLAALEQAGGRPDP